MSSSLGQRETDRETPLTNLVCSHVFQSVHLRLLPLEFRERIVRQLLAKLPQWVLEGPQLVVHRATEGEQPGGHDRPSSSQHYLKETANDATSVLKGKQ